MHHIYKGKVGGDCRGRQQCFFLGEAIYVHIISCVENFSSKILSYEKCCDSSRNFKLLQMVEMNGISMSHVGCAEA